MFALLAGVAAGASIAALAGARRTETSYARFLERTKAFDLLIANGGSTAENSNKQFDFDQVARLPQVADAAFIANYTPSGTGPSGLPISQTDIVAFASPDGRFGTDLNQARVLEGGATRRQRHRKHPLPRPEVAKSMAWPRLPPCR